MQTKGQLMKSLHTAFSFAPPSILSLTICFYNMWHLLWTIFFCVFIFHPLPETSSPGKFRIISRKPSNRTAFQRISPAIDKNSNAGTHSPHLNRCFRNTFYSVFSSGSFSSEASSFSSSSAAVSSVSSFISSAGISVFGEASSSVSSADISAC